MDEPAKAMDYFPNKPKNYGLTEEAFSRFQKESDRSLNQREALVLEIVRSDIIEPTTVEEFLDGLRTIGFEEYVVECMKTRWKTVDRIIGGTCPNIISHTPVTTWAAAIIEGIDKSWPLPITAYPIPPKFVSQENKDSRFGRLKSFLHR